MKLKIYKTKSVVLTLKIFKIACVYAKRWDYRVKGYEGLLEHLIELNDKNVGSENHRRNEAFELVIPPLVHGLNDKLFAVSLCKKFTEIAF